MSTFLSFEEVIDLQRLQPFLDRLLIPSEIDTALHHSIKGQAWLSGSVGVKIRQHY